jgi:hypothetical protein
MSDRLKDSLTTTGAILGILTALITVGSAVVDWLRPVPRVEVQVQRQLHAAIPPLLFEPATAMLRPDGPNVFYPLVFKSDSELRDSEFKGAAYHVRMAAEEIDRVRNSPWLGVLFISVRNTTKEDIPKAALVIGHLHATFPDKVFWGANLFDYPSPQEQAQTLSSWNTQDVTKPDVTLPLPTLLRRSTIRVQAFVEGADDATVDLVGADPVRVVELGLQPTSRLWTPTRVWIVLAFAILSWAILFLRLVLDRRNRPRAQ